jgi:hypothetical protein
MALRLGSTPHITDVMVFAGHPQYSGHGPVPHAKHFRERVQLAPDLWIGPLGKAAERVMNACTPRGLRTLTPVRQFGSRYSIIRTNAPTDPHFTWDPDGRLKEFAALSRLVRPTTLSTDYAARIVRREGEKPEIIPAGGRVGEGTYVIDTSENWIRDEDIEPLRTILTHFKPDLLPKRIWRALWLHEYTAGVVWVDLKWVHTIAALESLVHTDERGKRGAPGSTAQFVGRLLTIQHLVPGVSLSEPELSEIYEKRSAVAHGGRLGKKAVEETGPLLLKAENLLRNILRSAILDPGIAGLFADDDVIRSRIPLAARSGKGNRH